MSTEEKFNAAVNVIRSLPKSGSYQPSHDVMLKFYSYFKQATEGKCDARKPAFWDVVGRAKWDAWRGLGDMSRERAMESYVAELHRIVETMSYTNNVAAFFDTVDGGTPPVSREDLELVAGDLLGKIKSPSPSTASEPSLDDSSRSATVRQNGLHDSDDEFVETEDAEMPTARSVRNPPPRLGNDTAFAWEEMRRTVLRLERDVETLKDRVRRVQGDVDRRRDNLPCAGPQWWPADVGGPAFWALLIVWPVVANRLYYAATRKSPS